MNGTPEPQKGTGMPESVTPDSVVEDVLKGLETVEAERDKFKDLAYRSAAELENYKRRTAKDREDLAAAMKERFALQLLQITDGLALANGAAAAGVPEEFKKYVEGYQAIGRQILAMLERMGLAEVAVPKDAAFHPGEQEAVLTEEVPGLKEPVVLEVLQKGYTLDGRLIRPARVRVGMPTPAPQT